jgi:hypothetical protein
VPKPVKAPAPVVKKVKPYPFAGQLEIAAAKKPISILVVTKEGLIAKLDAIFVHVGEHYKVHFELPVVGRSILTEARVMKTYDRALDKKGSKVERMAEFRFEKLSEDHRSYLSTFLTAIGQTK